MNFITDNPELKTQSRQPRSRPFLLIDGHYYLYRSYFAIQGLMDSQGRPTNAIYGFLKSVRKMISDVQAEFGAVIWDCGLPERRTVLQPHYKQHRKAMPEPLQVQEPIIMSLCPLLGLESVMAQNTEADDLIASYVQAAREKEREVVIATNDKDILQLVGEGITIYSTAKADVKDKRGFALLGAAEVQAKWKVEPHQIGDVLALVGDASDNISGVPGIGEKTAVALIQEHGCIQNLLSSLDSLKNEKLRIKLKEAIKLIHQNQVMVQLDKNLPLPLPIEKLRITPQYSQLLAELQEWEFKKLFLEVEKEAGLKKMLFQQAELF